ncbi:hypothetical protein AZI86_14105 [Bdellovibrio bacteriovorus]|uniref:Uncharacterized protein n=1 Tax=Bdellovibrio bacteriovorus TaxID=959 RepID=A0A150WK77_BDEBC|nr:hypothetical protein [Bdellovibrio bacteriovorus]KYG63941.1 hypothetical protein AZI86_14105 [Bdellovibrio bacteriovorus]
MRYGFYLLLFLFSFQAEAKRSTEWALHIDTKLEARYFPQDYGEDTNNENFRLELQPNYKWTYLDSIRFYLKPDYVTDPGNKSESERNYFDFTEAYLRYKGDTISLQAGYALYSWGVTDGYNPIDIVNSKQYFDPLQSRKMGALSLSYSQSFETWDYDLIYIPQNKGAILPGENSRWLPREIFIPETPDNDIVLLLPETLRYRFGARENLNDALDNNIAARIQWRGFVDLGLYYYDGVASFPLVKPQVTGSVVQVSPKTVVSVDPDVFLKTQNYRLRQGAISMVRNQWDLLFKLAATYQQSIGDDSYLPGWMQETVLAMEKNFQFGSDGMLIAVLQKSFISSEKSNDSNLSTTEIFRDSWMLGGRLSWSEVWSASLLGLLETRHNSNYSEFGIGRRLGDAWNLNISARLISGDAQNPLGVYEKNDSYSLSLSRSF